MTDYPDSTIAPTVWLDKSTVLEAPVRLYGSVLIHKNCSIGRFSFVSHRTCLHAGTKVGRYCSIGKNCEIGAWEHPLGRLSTSSISYSLAYHFPDHGGVFPQVPLERPLTTMIGNDVWVGSGAIIRRGVTIGDGAVIAAGAFVSRDVGPYEIFGGTPAKLIRLRFEPEIVRALMALKWWDLEVADIATVPFDDIPAAIKRLREIRAVQPSDGSMAETGTSLALAEQTENAKQSAPSHKAQIAALQAMINAVPADPRHAADSAHQAFALFLRDKLFDAGAPEPLIDAVLQEAAGLETRYAPDDPVDIAVLNSKLQHLIELVSLRADPDAPLDAGLRRTLREVLRSKL